MEIMIESTISRFCHPGGFLELLFALVEDNLVTRTVSKYGSSPKSTVDIKRTNLAMWYSVPYTSMTYMCQTLEQR